MLHLLVQGSIFEARLLRGGEPPETDLLAVACHFCDVALCNLALLEDVGEAGLVFFVAQQRQP